MTPDILLNMRCNTAHDAMYRVYTTLIEMGRREEADAVMVACAQVRQIGNDAFRRQKEAEK